MSCSFVFSVSCIGQISAVLPADDIARQRPEMPDATLGWLVSAEGYGILKKN